MSRLLPSVPTIILSLSMLLTIIGFAMKHDFKYIVNFIAVYLIYLGFLYFENKKKIRLRIHIKLFVILVIVFHFVLGRYFNFYATEAWFDNSLHLFASFSFSIFYYDIIKSTLSFSSDSKVLTFILIASIAITSGVLFEIFEFLMDIAFNSYNQKGLVDTNLDLIFNVLGSFLGGIYGVYSNKGIVP